MTKSKLEQLVEYAICLCGKEDAASYLTAAGAACVLDTCGIDVIDLTTDAEFKELMDSVMITIDEFKDSDEYKNFKGVE